MALEVPDDYGFCSLVKLNPSLNQTARSISDLKSDCSFKNDDVNIRSLSLQILSTTNQIRRIHKLIETLRFCSNGNKEDNIATA